MASDSKDFKEYELPAVVNRDPYFVIHDFSDERLPAELRRPGSVQRWEREKRLGKGNFGTVWLEVLRSGKPSGPEVRAVKAIARETMGDKRELAAMTDFSRRNYVHTGSFVESFGWFEDIETMYIAMEYIPHGTLSRYIGQGISENGVRKITGQLLIGLALMHEHDYAHRDLKPDNILVDAPGPEWSVKIGDFGVSKRAKKELTVFKTGTGTEHYQAPEIQGDVELEDEEEEYTNIVDMWSLGCVVFEMAARTVIFPKWPRDYKKLCWGRWYPDKPRGLSQKGWDFITKLLVPDPTGRLSAVEALKHEWIASRDPQPLTGEVVEGPGATAPPPNNAPGLDSEDFRHTMIPSRAPFSRLQSEPPVADAWNRDERFGRPVDTNSINVPGAIAMKPRTWTTVLQSGNNGKIQAGNGYENDALAASSAKLPQIMSSSGEHGDDNPTASSQHRTVIRRVSHANNSDSVSADDPHHGARASSIQVIAPATEQVKCDPEPAGKSQHATIVRRTVEQPSIPDPDDIDLFPDSSDDIFAASSDDGEGFKTLFSEPLPPVTTSKVNAVHTPSTKRVNGMPSAWKTVAQPSSEAAEDRIDPGYGLKLMFEEKPQAMAAMNGSQTANDRHRQQKSRDTFTLIPKQTERRVHFGRRGRQVPRDDSDDDGDDED